MAEPRHVLITGASRGLGLASAARLHREGWTVTAAMRSVDEGLARLRAATGAGDGDRRLVGVRLDLDDPTSIIDAVRTVLDTVGTPDVVVHNAGVAGVGCVEEMPDEVGRAMFDTNLFGPIALTRALLPAMRGQGHGRIVVVSSESGVSGMPGIGMYSASKGALERWAESLAYEVAPYGLGVTVLVAGTFDTDILGATPSYEDPTGPNAILHAKLRRLEPLVHRLAAPPERFARALSRSIEDTAPFRRRAVGIDARILRVAGRALPTSALQRGVRRGLGLPGPGSLRGS